MWQQTLRYAHRITTSQVGFWRVLILGSSFYGVQNAGRCAHQIWGKRQTRQISRYIPSNGATINIQPAQHYVLPYRAVHITWAIWSTSEPFGSPLGPPTQGVYRVLSTLTAAMLCNCCCIIINKTKRVNEPDESRNLLSWVSTKQSVELDVFSCNNY